MSMFTTQTRITGLSGFDTETMVNQLMKAESMKYDKLYQQRELLRYKRDAYQTVTQSLMSFQSKFLDFTKNTATNIRSVANWQASTAKVTTTVGGASVESKAITVKPATGTAAGTYSVEVKQVAQGDVYKSIGFGQNLTGEAVNFDSINENDVFMVSLDGGTAKEIKIDGDLWDAVQALKTGATPPATPPDFVNELNLKLETAFGREPLNAANPNAQKITASIDSNNKLTITAGTGHTASVSAPTAAGSTSGLDALGLNVSKKSTGIDLNAQIKDVSALNLNGSTAFKFTINGKEISFNNTDSFNDIMNRINTAGADVKMSFDSTNQQFRLESTNTGVASGKINFTNISYTDSSGVTQQDTTMHTLGDVFGFRNNNPGEPTFNTYTQQAQDAVVSVNGGAFVSRESNSFTIDGLSITLSKDAAGPTGTTATPITYSVDVAKDSGQVLNLVKSFITDYNELVTSLNKAYNQKRTTYNTYSHYEPLTEAQKKDMSESEVAKWEEQAKTGMLYRDQTVNKIITQLRSMVYEPVTLSDGSKVSLYQMGITIDGTGNAANGKTGHLMIDDAKFEKFVTENSDKVAEYFTKSSDVLLSDKTTGAQTRRYKENGFAERLNDIIWKATSSNGTLYNKAGLPDTVMQTDMSKLIAAHDKKIADMLKYLQSKENSYYAQFSKMEKAINDANTQMASILGMMGLTQQ